MPASDSDIPRAIDAVWRIESAKLIAALARIVRDVGVAEDLAQDALVSALKQWPESGVPDNPGAWLMGAAKHRAIDYLRRNKRIERSHEELGRTIEAQQEMSAPDLDAAIDDDVGDNLLRLIFTACHPVLSPEARVALTLRLLGGLTTDEIARAFLVPEPTIAQRIVRAKRTLSDEQVPYEVPRGAELTERLASVLEVIYLVFNEGYSATAGSDWMRPGLCEEALRLGRILAEIDSKEPEVHGLVALMEIQASRSRARTGPGGEPILLLEQNRALWDQLLIRRGLAALNRAEKLGGARGPYALQAAIAACHARATTPEGTDWPRIAALYTALAQVVPSPVVELNRAVAFSMAFGPAAGLQLVDALTAEPSLKEYHLLPSVRGDLLFKLGRFAEARPAFERAAALTRNARERELLLGRARACAPAVPTLIILCGLPYAGKSTLARELSAQKGYALVSFDSVWQEAAAAQAERPDGDAVMKFADEKVKTYLKTGTTVVYDTLHCRRDWRERVVGLARSCDAHHTIVYVNTPPDIVLQRFNANAESNARHQIKREVLEDELKKFEPPESPEQFIEFKPEMHLHQWVKAFAI